MQRWDIINHFIKKNNYTSYLEIGYYKGWSFDMVDCPNKIAVDPNPCKTQQQEGLPYGNHLKEGNNYIIKLSSDDYFKKLSGTALYDIVFIDGLHFSHQVLKDFLNSVRFLKPNGTIIFHDCNPPVYEHTTTGIQGCWTGDVYKAFLEIRGMSPYKTCVVDTDWGVGICGNMPKEIENPYPIITEIPENEWKFFSENRVDLLNLISVEDFKKYF